MPTEPLSPIERIDELARRLREHAAALSRTPSPETLPEAFDRHAAAKDAKIEWLQALLQMARDALDRLIYTEGNKLKYATLLAKIDTALSATDNGEEG